MKQQGHLVSFPRAPVVEEVGWRVLPGVKGSKDINWYKLRNKRFQVY